MATNATPAQPDYVTFPHDRIRKSATNPRQRFNDLAASIRTHGLLRPILVRPLRNHFELLVGARRLRAAPLTGLTACRRKSRLDNRSAREVQIIENLQRQDVHPLEEADGYKALLDRSVVHDRRDRGQGRKVEGVRLSVAVCNATRASGPRGRRERCASPVLRAQLAPLDPATQVEALERCFRPLGGDAKCSREWLEPIGRRQEWLAEHARLDPRGEHAKEPLPELARRQLASIGHSVAVKTKLAESNLWFSGSGSRSSLHFDPFENLLVQVQGRKAGLVFDPAQTPLLYPRDARADYGDIFSAVDADAPDLVRHPRYAESSPLRFELSRGAGLYMPAFWWHHVRTQTLSISVNFWWRPALHQMFVRNAASPLVARFNGNWFDESSRSSISNRPAACGRTESGDRLRAIHEARSASNQRLGQSAIPFGVALPDPRGPLDAGG